jgi:hypothetical protein
VKKLLQPPFSGGSRGGRPRCPRQRPRHAAGLDDP